MPIALRAFSRENLNASLWFKPALMTIAAGALAIVLTHQQEDIDSAFASAPWGVATTLRATPDQVSVSG